MRRGSRLVLLAFCIGIPGCLYHAVVEVPSLSVTVSVRESGVPVGGKPVRVLVSDEMSDLAMVSALSAKILQYREKPFDVSTSEGGQISFEVSGRADYRGNMFPLPISSDWDRSFLISPDWPRGPVYKILVGRSALTAYKLDRNEGRFAQALECESVTVQAAPDPGEAAAPNIEIEVIIDRETNCET